MNDIPCSYLLGYEGRLIIVKMSVLLNLIYRFKVISIKIPELFCQYWQTDFKVYMERQKTQNSQFSIEGEEQLWRVDSTWHQDLL